MEKSPFRPQEILKAQESRPQSQDRQLQVFTGSMLKQPSFSFSAKRKMSENQDTHFNVYPDFQLTPLVRKQAYLGFSRSGIPQSAKVVSENATNKSESPPFILSPTLALQTDGKPVSQSHFGEESSSKNDSDSSLKMEDKQKLKNILDKLLSIASSKKKWFMFQEMIEEKQFEFEDPTPDFVEGIFFVKVSSWTNILRCRRPFIQSKICVYDARSFYLFDHKSRLRNLVVLLTESSEFHHLTLSIILLTTLTLVIYNYEDPNSMNNYNQLLDQINTYSSYFYFMEFALQLITKGVFVHPNSYFRDVWNWLDFLVVFAGLTEMTKIPNLPIKGFRAFRVLRPLRSIRQFPRLRKLISGLLSSIPQLLNAIFFMLFVFLQFSIFGSQQFGGANYNRCRLPGGVINGVWPIDVSQPSICSQSPQGYQCKRDTVCGSPLDVTLDYHDDLSQSQTLSFNDYGISNFDNPINSLLTIFQCVTLEGWSSIMFNLMNHQNGIVVVIFFTLIVVLGAFFLIHVILAVVGHSLTQNDMMETSEANIAKEKLAVSLKRREMQLQLSQKQKFREQVCRQQESQRQTDNFELKKPIQNDGEERATSLNLSTKNDQMQANANAMDPVATERNLLSEMGPAQEEVAFQDIGSQQVQSSNNSEHIKVGRVMPEEEASHQSIVSVKRVPNPNMPTRTLDSKVYLFFYKICISPLFSISMTLIIVANAVIMALDHYPIAETQLNLISIFNQMFSWIFVCEMIVKLTGLGFKEYVRDSFNRFDAVIVIISVVDNVIFYSVGNRAGGGGVIILRSIRLLRVLKLARNWTSLRILINKMIDTLPNLASFAFLLLIFQIVFIILGLQFFSGTVYLDQNDKIVSAELGNPPLNNFENLFNATSTVFAVMMTDNWNVMMYQYYRGLGVAAQVYFIGTVVVLNTVLLNLFLALFLESFENSTKDVKSDEQELSGLAQFQAAIFKFLHVFLSKIPPRIESKLQLISGLSRLQKYFVAQEEQHTDQDESDELVMQKSLRKLGTIHLFEKDVRKDWQLLEAPEKTEQRKKLLSIAQLVKSETLHEIMEAKKKQLTQVTGTSFWFLTRENWLRRICLYIYNLAHYDDISNFMVVFSTILLTIDNPLDDPLSNKQFVLVIFDYITTAVFTFESLIKMVVFGLLLNGKTSYFREPWNFLDFFVVLVSLLSYLPLGFDIKFYKSMRLLRILRPLRMIQRNQGLKIAIKSLINVLPGVLNLLLISGINLGLLAVLGINLFKGTFYSCNMANVPLTQQHLIKNLWDCQDYGGEWVNSDKNFDNFWNAGNAVFQIMTTEAWYAIATQAQQSTNVLQMPSPMASRASFIYFVIVIFIQSLFMGNLFIGVVISTFSAEKEKFTHNALLTNLEYEYLDICTKCFLLKPRKVFNQKQLFRRLCFRISNSKLFQDIILVCILANTALLTCTWYGQTQQMSDTIELVNLAFSVVYSLEFLIKVIALRTDYFRAGWNQLDFSIVFCVIIGYLFKFLASADFQFGLTVVRIFRVFRIMKLIRQITLLRRYFQTFIESIPEILNIGSLLLLFLFMFVILGMNLFANVQLQTNLNHNINFQSFGVAFLSLFISCTGENWPLLMADLSRQRSITFQCLESQTFDQIEKDGILGCGQPLSLVFFPIFYTFMAFVMLNLFSAIILEGFRKELLDELQKIRSGTLEMFQNLWKLYDPNATGMIAIDQLQDLILDFVIEEIKIQKKVPVNRQKVSEEILFNFRHKKLLTLSAKWRERQDDGSPDYFNLTKSEFFQQQLSKQLLKFIGELQIPSYNRFQNFNFYDVLISFVNFSFTQRQMYEHHLRKNMILKLRETKQDLSKLDAIELFSDDFFKLKRTERERLVEMETENFINIIHRIEKKGRRENLKIQKLEIMHGLRRKNVLRNKEILDDLDGQVVSSKLLIAAKTITFFVAKWKEKNRLRKLKASFESSYMRSCLKSYIHPKSSTKKSNPTIKTAGSLKEQRKPIRPHSESIRRQGDQQTGSLKRAEKTSALPLEELSVVQMQSAEKLPSDQSIDRCQVVDQQVLQYFQIKASEQRQAREDQKISRLPQSVHFKESNSPQILASDLSVTNKAVVNSKQKSTLLGQSLIAYGIHEKTTPQIKSVKRYQSYTTSPRRRISIFGGTNVQKLSPDLLQLSRQRKGSVKVSTLQIYNIYQPQKKVSQEQVHKNILKSLNHKPWRRFQKEVAESDKEDEAGQPARGNSKQLLQQRSPQINAQKMVRVHPLKLNTKQRQNHILIRPASNLADISSSISGNDSVNERSLTWKRSPKEVKAKIIEISLSE